MHCEVGSGNKIVEFLIPQESVEEGFSAVVQRKSMSQRGKISAPCNMDFNIPFLQEHFCSLQEYRETLGNGQPPTIEHSGTVGFLLSGLSSSEVVSRIMQHTYGWSQNF